MVRRKPRAEIIIEDSVYEITPYYIAGAEHARKGRPWHGGNPHREGSQRHDEWEAGYINEEAGFHKGIDLTIPGEKQGFDQIGYELAVAMAINGPQTWIPSSKYSLNEQRAAEWRKLSSSKQSMMLQRARAAIAQAAILVKNNAGNFPPGIID